MGDELKRQLIERMRMVQWSLQSFDSRSIVLPGEVVDLAEYGQRLKDAYEHNDKKAARHLLAAVL